MYIHSTFSLYSFLGLVFRLLALLLHNTFLIGPPHKDVRVYLPAITVDNDLSARS